MSAPARRARIGRRALAVGALAIAALLLFSAVHRRGAGTPKPKPATTRATASQRRARGHRGLPAAPVAVRGAAARRMRIPILMYHVVSTPPPGTANPGLWVPEASFERHMRALERAGYHAITLRQAYDGWTKGAGLPRRPVVLSFDDGYLSHFTHARPVLRALHWPGVLNLVLHNLGPDGITAREVRSLLANGWELDSHTIDHPDLTTLGAAELRRELVGSRRSLRRRFGVPVDFICYPSGRYDATVEAAAKAAGYRAGTTTDEGAATRGDLFALKRVRVDGGDSAAAVLGELAAVR